MKKTNNTWNGLLAAVALAGLTVTTSCVKNEESDGVKAIREATAGKIAADAELQKAEATYKLAEGKLKEAEVKSKEAETAAKELANKVTEGALTENIAAAVAQAQSTIVSAEASLLTAQTSLLTAQKNKAKAQAELDLFNSGVTADNPKYAAWKTWYDKLYDGNGLYQQVQSKTTSLQTVKKEITNLEFQAKVQNTFLPVLKNDSIDKKNDLDYKLSKLNLYRGYLTKEITAADTAAAKVPGKDVLTPADWASLQTILKNLVITSNNRTELNTTIASLKSAVTVAINHYDDAVRALGTYYKGNVSDNSTYWGKSVAELKEIEESLQAEINALNDQIEDIEAKMAEVLA